MSEKGSSGQPEENRAVLADRPQHPKILKTGIGFPQDMNADVFKLI
jgi:hypothetical protein